MRFGHGPCVKSDDPRFTDHRDEALGFEEALDISTEVYRGSLPVV
jgi:hypothetical protein